MQLSTTFFQVDLTYHSVHLLVILGFDLFTEVQELRGHLDDVGDVKLVQTSSRLTDGVDCRHTNLSSMINPLILVDVLHDVRIKGRVSAQGILEVTPIGTSLVLQDEPFIPDDDLLVIQQPMLQHLKAARILDHLVASMLF